MPRKLSDLVPVMASALGCNETTLGVIARHLRVGGMITSKGRGPGAADMSAADCANLLLGVLVTHVGVQGKDAAAAIPMVRSLVIQPRSFDNYQHWRDKGAIQGPLTKLIADLAWTASFGEAMEILLNQDRATWQEFMGSIPSADGFRHFRVAIGRNDKISASISFRLTEALAIQLVYEPAGEVTLPAHPYGQTSPGDMQSRISFGPSALTALMDFLSPIDEDDDHADAEHFPR